MSIVRVGLAQTSQFAEGYDAIFGGGKKQASARKPKAKAKSKPAAAKKKAVKKKKK